MGKKVPGLAPLPAPLRRVLPYKGGGRHLPAVPAALVRRLSTVRLLARRTGP